MPIIEINKKDLEKILNKKLDEKQLDELMQYTKAGIEKIEGDTITLEIKDSNRPDMLSVEGVGRELLGVTGKEKGLAAYKASKSDYEVIIDKKVNKVRPEIVCAVVKDLKLDDHSIKQIIQLQEKLCDGFGRKRKEAAIGVYDFDKIKWPVHYTTFKSDEIKFVPLEMKQALSPRQILQMNEKGKEYANLLEGSEDYPFIIDSEKNVLSMPPIINSDHTGKVTENTKNVFVEVTGFNFDRISQTLNIILAALADRKGKIFSVSLKNKCITPIFKNKKKSIALADINSRLGIGLKPAEVVKILEKARYSAKIKKDKVEVEIPFYRTDVIHAVDVIEDIAIAYGYQNIPAEEPMIAAVGSMLPETLKTEKIAKILVGLGLHELATFNMTNKEDLFKKMNLNTNGIVEIENPVSSTYSCLRNALIPSLMSVLSQNTTSDYPQRIFEIGKTVEINEKSENKTDEKTKLAVTISHSAAGFTEIMQIIDYLLSNLKLGYKIDAIQHNSFIDGRAAEIIINNKPIGILGEINPKVLESWKLEMPVVAAEIDLTELMNLF